MLYIKNAYIKTMEGADLARGDILVQDGKIVEVGEHVNAPSEATVIDGEGMFITPGLVDAHSHAGLREDGNKVEGEDVNEIPNSPICPQVRAIDAVNVMDRALTEAYENGITSIVISTGSLNVVGGQAAAIKTCGTCVDNMIIKHPVAVKIALGENTKGAYGALNKTPRSRLGIASLLRETLYKAKHYKEALESADESKRPPFDMQMEALLPVMRGDIPLKTHAHRADDILTALRVAREFGVKLTLEHCTEGHLILEEIVKSGFPAVVGPSLIARSKVELKNHSIENAGALVEAGVKVALTTDAPVEPLKYLIIEAQLLLRGGLKEEDAWRGMTINPAEIIGIENRVGSLGKGKDADIVIFTANPLQVVDAHVAMTIMDGKIIYQNAKYMKAITDKTTV